MLRHVAEQRRGITSRTLKAANSMYLGLPEGDRRLGMWGRADVGGSPGVDPPPEATRRASQPGTSSCYTH